MNEYAQDLKSKLERVNDYVVHTDTPSMTNVFAPASQNTKKILTFKNVLWTIGILIISISVVAFFTQAVLLAVHNGNTIVQGQDSGTILQEPTGPQLYVRADIKNPVLGVADEATTTGTTSDVFEEVSTKVPLRSVDLGIPGVSRIGYAEDMAEGALTDNINKYSNTTLVLGEDRGSGGQLIGGGDQITPDNYETLPNAIAPVLSSKAYLVADLDTGEIIYEKNADQIHPLASVSKLMTALVAREKMDLQTVAIVSRDASRAYGAQGNLALGEKIRLRDLLFPLLMESSNDAAEVFADQYGHAKFIEEMNKKAISLEMYDTYYGDPSGLDPKNTSTPKDLLKLARYIYMNDPEIYDMTRVKQFSIKGHTWYNANGLLPVTGFAGGKNGYIDQAKQTTVSLFDVDLAKGGVRTVVVVILKSDAKNNDVAKLLNFLRKSVTYKVE